MAFEGLSEKLGSIFKKLKGRGVLTEADINSAMREVRLALLEADVNFKVVKEFTAKVKEKALGEEVMKSLTPAQQVIKIVNDEMTDLLGGRDGKLTFSSSGFTAILLAGLQGTGKTTSAAKLAVYLRKQGKNPLLAACDVQRPAAIDQLEILGREIGIPVFSDRLCKDPAEISKKAREYAERKGFNVLIVDTAGRLHIDDALMEELKAVKSNLKPHEILLVIDAMTGQDAVNAAAAFNDTLGIDGLILTKLDGDARGGAALSVKSVTGRPIKFVGTGEKPDAFEPFHPKRMASRILGMGDVLSLVEKASENFDREKAEALEKRLAKNRFTLEDFMEQIGQVKKMGGMEKIMDMLPGASGRLTDEQLSRSEREFKTMEAAYNSMTAFERKDVRVLDASRRKRIAKGAGVGVSDVNKLIGSYEQLRKMMKQMNDPKFMKRFSKGRFHI